MATRAKWQTREHDRMWRNQRDRFQEDWRKTLEDSSNRASDEMANQIFTGKSGRAYHDRNFQELESAFQYGHAARRHYGERHPRWNDALRDELRQDYEGDWTADGPFVRYAYDYTRANR